MKIAAFAFSTTNWSEVERIEYSGETGMAYWRTQFFGKKPDQIHVRMVEYTHGYLADHWCQKGHILYCIEGELETMFEDGRKFVLKAGMSYQVGDDAVQNDHRRKTFIVD